jgi:hypothetical protein
VAKQSSSTNKKTTQKAEKTRQQHQEARGPDKHAAAGQEQST